MVGFIFYFSPEPKFQQAYDGFYFFPVAFLSRPHLDLNPLTPYSGHRNLINLINIDKKSHKYKF